MENVTSAAGKAMLSGLFKPNPGIGILKFWQGIVEIALRIGSLVLLFVLFICCCATLSILNGSPGNVVAAPGWLLFVSMIAMIIEGLILASRFLNFGFVVKFGTIVHIVDIVISFGIATAIFCGAIAVGVYSGTFARSSNFTSSTGATSAFGFFTLFVFIGLGVFMILSLVFKWRNSSKYSGSSSDGEFQTEDE